MLLQCAQDHTHPELARTALAPAAAPGVSYTGTRCTPLCFLRGVAAGAFSAGFEKSFPSMPQEEEQKCFKQEHASAFLFRAEN